LSLISSEAPTKIQSTLINVKEFSEQLASVEQDFEKLKEQAPEHLAAASAFLEKLGDQLEAIDKLEMERSYLLCLKTIEDLR